MTIFRRSLVFLLFIFSPAQTQDWLAESRAWFDFRQRIYTPSQANDLLKNVLAGDFSFNGETDIVRGPSWSVNLSLRWQSIFGGIKDRRMKIYAVNYVVDLTWQKRIWSSFPMFFISSFHQSTHLADPLPLESRKNILEFQELNLEIGDLNLIRLGFFEELGDDAWRLAIQPIRLNYFLFAEPQHMFKGNSYQAYGKRLYFYGLKTIWRDDSYRLAASFEGEMEGGTHYIVKGRFSTRLSENPQRDRLQLFIAYEGGLHTNHIRATPYNGLTTERVLAGGRIFF